MALALGCAALCFTATLSAQDNTRIGFVGVAGGDTTSKATVTVSGKTVQFYGASRRVPDTYSCPTDHVGECPDARFQAFWLTGDGNFLTFSPTSTDSESRNPGPYTYAREGAYTVTMFMIGKYTDRIPPAMAARGVNTGADAAAPSGFNEKVPAGDWANIFAFYQFRPGYNGPLALSYRRDIRASSSLLFYNGKVTSSGSIESVTAKKLTYSTTQLPDYANGQGHTAIGSSDLYGGTLDGLYPTNEAIALFQQYSRRYADVVHFGAEPAGGVAPERHSEKRLFPVFVPDATIDDKTLDSTLHFTWMILSLQPPTAEQATLLRTRLIAAGLEQLLFDFDSIPLFSNDYNYVPQRERITDKAISQPSLMNYYLVAITSTGVPQALGHDPNQFIVEKIEPLSDGKYKVFFRLEMCNKGAGDVKDQTVTIYDAGHKFSNFQMTSGGVDLLTDAAAAFKFKSHLFIPGIPAGEYAPKCQSVLFSAETDCAGIQALWKSNAQQPLEACVVFSNSNSAPECNYNFGIDSCDFKKQGTDECLCVEPEDRCDWSLILVLLLVVGIIVWWWRRRD